MAALDVQEGCRKGSSWWRGICRLGSFNNELDWFQKGLKRKLGIGNNIRFWEKIWFGPRSMREAFPTLYNVSEDKEKVIASLGSWEGDRWL